MSETANPARLVGRLLRFVTGVLMLYLILPVLQAAPSAFLVSAAITIALILGFYLLLHIVIAKRFESVNKWVGAFIAVAPVVIVFIFVEPTGEVASVAYVGASLILMAVRGDGGCEVMAFPSLLLGRFTHLVCIAFSPIDWLENKIASRLEARDPAPD